MPGGIQVQLKKERSRMNESMMRLQHLEMVVEKDNGRYENHLRHDLFQYAIHQPQNMSINPSHGQQFIQHQSQNMSFNLDNNSSYRQQFEQHLPQSMSFNTNNNAHGQQFTQHDRSYNYHYEPHRDYCYSNDCYLEIYYPRQEFHQ